MEDIKLNKYIKPEIEIEYFSPSEDIMNVSSNASSDVYVEVEEDEETVLGVVDVESLVGVIKNIPNIFK